MPSTSNAQDRSNPQARKAGLNPSAGIAAWVLPGLGHVLLGETKRGLIIGLSILILWTSGLFIGTVGVINRDKHPYWFYGQVLLAPSLLVNAARQSFMVEAESPELLQSVQEGRAESARILLQPAFGHPSEQGVLFTAMAGLLNLLAVFDVTYRDPKKVNAATKSKSTDAIKRQSLQAPESPNS